MPRNKLKESQVRAAREPGMLSDGDGLYLAVSKAGGKSWTFIYRRAGKRTELGLGSYTGTSPVTLAAARAKADEVRTKLANGEDPKAGRKIAATDAITFGGVADEYIAAMESTWRNRKHRQQWTNTLQTHGAKLRKLDVATLSTEDIVAALKPIWTKLPETASRLRGRFEKILDSAKARGLRTGDNPARWRGHLDLILPSHKKRKRGHHRALPYDQLPAFLADLRKQPGAARFALEFTILTASRTGETAGARWTEFDLESKVWTVPGARMKGGRPHRVPLSDAAVAIVQAMKGRAVNDLVFPGRKSGRPISDMTLTAILRRMNRDDVATTHGFRSTFRDWVYDCTDHPREIAEAALAHVFGDETERAYRRGDALERRRKLMVDWAEFCVGSADG